MSLSFCLSIRLTVRLSPHLCSLFFGVDRHGSSMVTSLSGCLYPGRDNGSREEFLSLRGIFVEKMYQLIFSPVSSTRLLPIAPTSMESLVSIF